MSVSTDCNTVARADLKVLVRISLPIMFFLFCDGLTMFCERIFLSYYSLDAIHGCLNESYLATIFQSPCIAIGTMAQVFVGFYQGSNERERIGPCVWQLIWFSLFSSLITIPLGFLASDWYFKDTVINKFGVEYFTILSFGNFLFPLSVALSSFYLGRGKTFFVTTLMLTSYVIHLSLSWLLIFGVNGIIPALGVTGAAFAKCISLGLLCLIFFISFLKTENQKIYRTDNWQFSPKSVWTYVQPGLLRASGYFSAKATWVAVSHIIIKKGGQYLDVLTIGGTIITLLVFITTGIYRSVLTIASNLIGAGKSSDIWALCRSFIIYVLEIAAVLSIPLIFFPNSLIYFFDSPTKEVFKRTFSNINHWIWIYMIALTAQIGLCAFLIALRDLKAQLFCYCCLWPISFLPIYFGIGYGQWLPDKLWAIMILENVAFTVFYFIRLRQKKLGEKVLSELN